jgi:hypothetical protein
LFDLQDKPPYLTRKNRKGGDKSEHFIIVKLSSKEFIAQHLYSAPYIQFIKQPS